ncbi:52 kDa repressor of the inhibitor of the protein kinase [Holothuria leucospilota]|uniref:52 kDa repressor of the inhibitor of the protein kinase n=1 Tax=Holothuria leucospilota TaxID=206669 RepID=A0A9Q1H9H9_HOLLE|nr:52 kDa repressor of the inhibitor of the protein kinase [Holothuria leucospilota]
MADIRNYFKPQKKVRKVDSEHAEESTDKNTADSDVVDIDTMFDESSEETVPIPTIPASEIAHSSREITGAPEHLGDRAIYCSVKSKTADRNSTKLKFNPEWKKENPWIKVVENGMVCSPCFEAYSNDANVIKKCHGAWVTVPVSNWKKGKEKIKSHRGSLLHRNAVALLEAKKQAEKQGHVLQLASEGMSKQREENRTLIKKLLRVVYFLAKQRIAHFTNFEGAVELVVECGDAELQKHMSLAAKNATYISNQMIEEYVQALGTWLEGEILASLKESEFFCVLADETTDVATIEELSVCARWLDSKGHWF